MYLITHTRTKTRTRIHVHKRMCIYYIRMHTHTHYVSLERGLVCSHCASVCAWVYVVRVGEYSGWVPISSHHQAHDHEGGLRSAKGHSTV